MKIPLLVFALLLAACRPVVRAPELDAAATQSAVSTAATLAPAPGTGVEPSWRTDLGGVINWMPQMLAAKDGSERLIVASEAGRVVALDPVSGAVQWAFAPPGQLWTDSVAVLGDGVFVASEGAIVTLLDGASGSVRWQRSLQPAQGEALAGLEARSKPVMAQGVVYVPTAGVGSKAAVSNPELRAPLLALNFETGDELWRFESDGYLLRAPHWVDQSDTLYVGSNFLAQEDVDEGGGLRIHALNPADGSLRWTKKTLDGLLKSLSADAQVVAYAAYRDFIVGLDSTSGAEVYRHNTGNWVQSFAVFPQLSAQLESPVLVYGSANAFLNAINPANGEFIWRYNVEGTFNYPIGNAVLEGDSIYFISQQGDLHALKAADGSLVWRHPTGLETRDGIAVGAGHIFVASTDGAVYGFRLR